MRLFRTITMLFLLVLAGCDNQTNTGSEAHAKLPVRRSVTLSLNEIMRLGITTTPAQPANYTTQLHGYGVVINTTTLAQQDAAIATAHAAERQSQVLVARARRLYAIHAISQETLEADERQAAVDDAAVVLAERTEAAAFGQRAPWRTRNRNDALLAKLTSDRTKLIEATFPLGSGLSGPPTKLTVAHLKTQLPQEGWTAVTIWDAPADPTIPGRSFFALIEGSDLEQGEHVLVFAPIGKPIAGIRIPSSSIVLSEDQAWCYVVIASGTFARRPVDLSLTLADGYFVAQGIGPGQPVVVTGTGLLLAREIGVAAASYK